MTRTRNAVAALIVAVLGAATIWLYVFRDDAGSGVVASNVRPSVVPETLNTTGAGITTGVSAPTLENRGTNWDQIFRSINDYENWTYEHPDPKLASSTIHPHCQCFQVTQAGLSDLATTGRRHSGPQLKVNQVSFRLQESPDQVRLYVILEGIPGDKIVGSQQTPSQDVPVLPPTGFQETLIRGPDGRWLRYDSVCLGPPGVGGGCSR